LNRLQPRAVASGAALAHLAWRARTPQSREQENETTCDCRGDNPRHNGVHSDPPVRHRTAHHADRVGFLDVGPVAGKIVGITAGFRTHRHLGTELSVAAIPPRIPTTLTMMPPPGTARPANSSASLEMGSATLSEANSASLLRQESREIRAWRTPSCARSAARPRLVRRAPGAADSRHQGRGIRTRTRREYRWAQSLGICTRPGFLYVASVERPGRANSSARARL
jgi:hypothetical protein